MALPNALHYSSADEVNSRNLPKTPIVKYTRDVGTRLNCGTGIFDKL